ncbi:MAG TPA: M15 family metallopeptidase [Xanthomonadales bacterium]|nr:M15 family metallopeptidase [Xanthomonadales bacterium]
MNRIRVQTCPRDDLPGVLELLDQHPNIIQQKRLLNLKRLQVEGCLWAAYNPSASGNVLQGLVGLDLDARRVSLLAMKTPAVLPLLLDAVERLAVSFGILELELQLDPTRKKAKSWPRQWIAAVEPGRLQRKLSRRLTAAARKALRVNQELGVPADYGAAHRLQLQSEPSQLASIGLDVFEREQFMTPRAASALQGMIRQAGSDGIAIQPVSAFRSVDYQCQLLQNKLDKGQDMAAILRVSAAPGYSEHHSGRAVDLTTPGFKPLEEEFADSEAFDWLSRSAAGWGFRLSYPRSNRHGVAYEPWHWYYTG